MLASKQLSNHFGDSQKLGTLNTRRRGAIECCVLEGEKKNELIPDEEDKRKREGKYVKTENKENRNGEVA